MFRIPVGIFPPFTRELLKNSNMVEMSNDRTLSMTATALLYNRVPNLKLQSTITRYSDDVPYNNDPEVYSFHWVETSENPDAKLEAVKDKFKKVVPFTAVEKYVQDKFKKTIYIRIFPEENAVAFYMESISLEMWHLLQSFISRYFKVFEQKPLTEDEVNFVRSLILRTPDNYKSEIMKITDTVEFRRFALVSQITGFEKSIYEKKLTVAQNDVRGTENSIEDLLHRYRELNERLFEQKLRVEALMNRRDTTEEVTEFQEWIIENKNLTNITISGSEIRFVVKTFIIPYLAESWENASRRGAIFASVRGPEELSDKDNLKILLDSIFSSNHSMKLKTCAQITLDYLGSDVWSDRSFDYSCIKDYIPNTHLSKHNCFGQNAPDIRAQLKMNDPIGAIECAINCVKHINVDELTATFIPFLNSFVNCAGKCLVSEETKEEFTPIEALHYLKEKMNESNTAGQPDETNSD